MTDETASQREQRQWEKQELKENFSIISSSTLNKGKWDVLCVVIITDALLKH